MLIQRKNPDVIRRKSPGVQSTDKSCDELITFTCVACFMQLGLVSAFPPPYPPQTPLVEAAHSKARAPTPLVEATHSKARAPFSNPSEQPYSCNFSWALRVLFLLLPFCHSLTFPFLSPIYLSPFSLTTHSSARPIPVFQLVHISVPNAACIFEIARVEWEPLRSKVQGISCISILMMIV